MNELPKNINTEQEFYRLREKHQCDYTIDDFIAEYRISKRLADTLLSDIDHISVTQGLHRRLRREQGIKRKKFFNREDVFYSLVGNKKVVFNLRYFRNAGLGLKSPEDKVTSEQIPSGYVFDDMRFFLQVLVDAEPPGEVTGLSDSYNEMISLRYKKVEGVEVSISGKSKSQIRRLYPLYRNGRADRKVLKMKHISPRLYRFFKTK